MDWLPRVRNSATMLSAASVVGRRAIQNREFSAVYDIAQSLKESDRSNFYQSLLGSWVSQDPLELYDRLEELPSSKLRSSAAGSLYLQNERSGGTVLTDQQRKVVESYLTDEQHSQLSEFAEKIDDLRYVLP